MRRARTSTTSGRRSGASAPRSFRPPAASTSWISGIKVLIDYAPFTTQGGHGASWAHPAAGHPDGPPGLPHLAGEPAPRRRGHPGDRREDDIREVGQVAPGTSTTSSSERTSTSGAASRGVRALVAEGFRKPCAAGPGPGASEIVLEEPEAVRGAIGRSRPGDLVVVCVDHAVRVWRELEAARPGQVPASRYTALEGDGQSASPRPWSDAQLRHELRIHVWEQPVRIEPLPGRGVVLSVVYLPEPLLRVVIPGDQGLGAAQLVGLVLQDLDMSTVGSRLGMPYTAMSRNRSSPEKPLRVAAVNPRVRVLDAVGHHPQQEVPDVPQVPVEISPEAGRAG